MRALGRRIWQCVNRSAHTHDIDTLRPKKGVAAPQRCADACVLQKAIWTDAKGAIWTAQPLVLTVHG